MATQSPTQFGGLQPSGGGSNVSSYYPQTPSVPNYNATPPTFGFYDGFDRQQAQGSNVNQIPVNVLDVRNQLGSLLNSYQQSASNYLNQFMQNGQFNNPASGYQVSLGSNFFTPNQLQGALNGGTDYFGNLGISQGLQNINLQNQAQNKQLANALGRTAGNESLIAALQGQNNFKSQLAGIPLISEAQQGTYGRALDMGNLQNQYQNMLNQTQLGQQGFNLGAILQGLSTQQAGLQPYNNLLEALTNLQGQQRGVTSSESQIGSRNFK